MSCVELKDEGRLGLAALLGGVPPHGDKGGRTARGQLQSTAAACARAHCRGQPSLLRSAACVVTCSRFLQGRDTDRATVNELKAAIRAGRECTVRLLNYTKAGK